MIVEWSIVICPSWQCSGTSGSSEPKDVGPAVATRHRKVPAKDHGLMTNDPRPRRCRPSLEGLEVRDLLSALAVHATTARHEMTPNLNLMVASETAAYTGPTSVKLSNAISGKSDGYAFLGQRELPAIAGRPALRPGDDDRADHRR